MSVYMCTAKKKAAMKMIFDALEWDDEENDPSGVNEPMLEMKMQVSPAQMRAKQSLIGWLAAEPTQLNVGFASFAVEAHKFLSRVAFLSSAAALQHFRRPSAYVNLFRAMKEWLEKIAPQLKEDMISS